MGTYLHAIVECRRAEVWNAVSEWHFGKDDLGLQLHDVPHEPTWPSDASFRGKYLIDRDTSENRQTVKPQDLPALTVNSSREYRSFVASLHPLGAFELGQVRVLFYRT